MSSKSKYPQPWVDKNGVKHAGRRRGKTRQQNKSADRWLKLIVSDRKFGWHGK